MLLARVSEVHFGLTDPTFGSVSTVLEGTTRTGAYKRLKVFWDSGLELEVAVMMKQFFKSLRQKRVR